MSTATATTLKTETQPDRNWVSLNRDTVVLRAGTSEERHYANDEVALPYLSYIPDKPKDWESALKCSGRVGTHLKGLSVAQCKENAADCNAETHDCSFEGDWGMAGGEGEQVLTVKGGSHHLAFAGEVWSRGTDCDIEVGAWSDQSTSATHHIDLSGLRHATGRPLTVVLARVHSPLMAALGRPRDIALPPNAKVLFWASLAEQCHWWAKRVAVAVGLVRSRR